MYSRNQVHMLVKAALLALAVISVPAGHAHAADSKESCAAKHQGFDSATGSCAGKTCTAGGTIYQPGEVNVVRLLGQVIRVEVCNGLTGQMEPARTATPSGPAAPAGNGTLAPTNTTPSGPVAPRPTTLSR